MDHQTVIVEEDEVRAATETWHSFTHMMKLAVISVAGILVLMAVFIL